MRSDPKKTTVTKTPWERGETGVSRTIILEQQDGTKTIVGLRVHHDVVLGTVFHVASVTYDAKLVFQSEHESELEAADHAYAAAWRAIHMRRPPNFVFYDASGGVVAGRPE